ncbi:MAG TPA: hypothetical protein VIW25_11865, partial [Nitrososphaeraceae archaeon]
MGFPPILVVFIVVSIAAIPLLSPLSLLNFFKYGYAVKSLSSPAACINYDSTTRMITISCASANLAEVYNQLNDNNVLEKQESSSNTNVWSLNANLTIDRGSTFYINSTDTAWLKIISDGTAAYGIDVHGSLKVDSVKITSWDPEMNYYAVTNGTRIPNINGYEV